MNEIIKALVDIEKDCSYVTAYNKTEIDSEKFYERVKGIITLKG